MCALAFDELEGAISAYTAILRGDTREPSFDNAVIEITTNGPPDEHAASKLVENARKSCRRLYATAKYGSPSRHLSKPDKEACKPYVTRPKPNTVRLDFSRPLRNAWRAARQWIAPAKQLDWLEKEFALLREKTTPLDQEHTLSLLKFMVAATALHLTTVGCFDKYLDHISKPQNGSELALEYPPQVTVGSGSTTLAKADRLEIAADTRDRLIRVSNVLSELNRDDPVYRFVGEQVVQFKPALFEVLAESGGGLINGVVYTSDGAKAAAKAVKRSTPATPSWKTTVTISS